VTWSAVDSTVVVFTRDFKKSTSSADFLAIVAKPNGNRILRGLDEER
jgi:hypothetical protein